MKSPATGEMSAVKDLCVKNVDSRMNSEICTI